MRFLVESQHGSCIPPYSLMPVHTILLIGPIQYSLSSLSLHPKRRAGRARIHAAHRDMTERGGGPELQNDAREHELIGRGAVGGPARLWHACTTAAAAAAAVAAAAAAAAAGAERVLVRGAVGRRRACRVRRRRRRRRAGVRGWAACRVCARTRAHARTRARRWERASARSAHASTRTPPARARTDYPPSPPPIHQIT
jgi:hypothetical protein